MIGNQLAVANFEQISLAFHSKMIGKPDMAHACSTSSPDVTSVS
jgi:hypothetical protein